MSGKVIVFDGIDGTGKSTQLELVAEELIKRGIDCYKTRNLGGTPIGEALREVMKSTVERPALTDLYISVAVQEALIDSLKTQLEQGKVVLIDRSPMSLVAYQCFGSGVSQDIGWQYADQGMQKLAPDLAIVYEADIETSLNRARAHSSAADYFESKDLEYFSRVSEGYKAAAERYKAHIIDANGSIESIHAATMALVDTVL